MLDPSSTPRLSLLSIPRLSSLIHRTVLERVGRAYGKICEAVKDAENRYESPTTLLGTRRPFGQMAVLWQVLGIEED